MKKYDMKKLSKFTRDEELLEILKKIFIPKERVDKKEDK